MSYERVITLVKFLVIRLGHEFWIDIMMPHLSLMTLAYLNIRLTKKKVYHLLCFIKKQNEQPEPTQTKTDRPIYTTV